MKTLMVMRHAKSSWANEDLSDFERPLNKRGKRDAPRIGLRLIEADLVPDLILSSKANRAMSTAILVAENSEYEPAILFRDRFYHGSVIDLVNEVKLAPASKNRLMVVGHNPGLEQLVERLTGEYERMPTAAIAFLKCHLTDWDTLNSENCELLEVWRPKEIFAEN